MRELNQPPSLLPTTDSLTGRAMDVLRLVAQGLSNDEGAEKLVVSERTVRTHISHIPDKLPLANRTEMALHAVREGIAKLNSNQSTPTIKCPRCSVS